DRRHRRLRVYPGRRRSERICVTGRDVAGAQVVRVTSADGWRTHTTAQQFNPAIEGGLVQLWPGAIPDLYRVEFTLDRVLPRRPERFGMVDAHDRAARRCRATAPAILHGERNPGSNQISTFQSQPRGPTLYGPSKTCHVPAPIFPLR